MKKQPLFRLTFSALCLALALILPIFTGSIPQIGQMLCPMHFPVLLCGFLCGPVWGAVIGFIAPLFRFLLFGMPVLVPTGLNMAFELAAYGACAGILNRLLPRNPVFVWVTLLVSMLAGRVIGGMARYVLVVCGLTSSFGFSDFLKLYVSSSVPGIALQIVLIPPLVLALRRAGIEQNEKCNN